MRVTAPEARLGLLLVAVALAAPAPVAAQLQASERASVSQVLDGTRATVEYGRPRARGRTGLFGRQVHADEIWTPGANRATTLSLSKDVTIAGTPVPKGTWSVWLVMTRPEWEMVLDRDSTLFHTQGPKPRAGQVRFRVPREKRPFMEALTWWFPAVGSTAMTLAMQWDTVYVPIEIRVTPTHTTAVTADAAGRVVGTYHLKMEPPPVPPGGPDTTLTADVPGAPELTMTVRHQGGELRATMDPPLFPDPDYADWRLIAARNDAYYLGRMQGGELADVWDFATVQFEVVDGTARSFEIRDRRDSLWGRAERVR